MSDSFALIIVIIYLIIAVVLIISAIINVIDQSFDKLIKVKLFKIVSSTLIQNKDKYLCDIGDPKFLDGVDELERLYKYYYRKNIKSLKKFDDLLIVLNEILISIKSDSDAVLKKNSLDEIKEFKEIIYKLIKYISNKYPNKEYTSNQQKILRDFGVIIGDCISNENRKIIEEEILQEFDNLNKDIEKNTKNNKITIILTVIGILVSIILGSIPYIIK